MTRSLAVFLTALAGLSCAIAVSAVARDEASVNRAAVLDGMPRALSDFGFFADLQGQQPVRGVRAYSLNTPLYSDGTHKLRFIYLPEGKQLLPDGEGLLQFPVGAAIIKTFAFGEGEARRLIETRLLLRRAEGWTALPYRWNETQSDAQLALAGGRVDLQSAQGESFSYRIPNKNQCKQCHVSEGAVIPIGPKARNLSADWLGEMVDAGWLADMPQGADSYPRWQERASASVQAVARAYLDVNCAHCHKPGGSASNSGLDLRWEQDNPFALGVGKKPVAAGRGAGGLLVSISPGQPDQSILVHRMASRDPGVAMPELGKATVDQAGLAAVRNWIAGMENP